MCRRNNHCFNPKRAAGRVLYASKKDDRLILYASDDLGFIYGIYKISREFLGILPFWFWNDQVIEAKEGYAVADDYSYASQPFQGKVQRLVYQ